MTDTRGSFLLALVLYKMGHGINSCDVLAIAFDGMPGHTWCIGTAFDQYAPACVILNASPISMRMDIIRTYSISRLHAFLYAAEKWAYAIRIQFCGNRLSFCWKNLLPYSYNDLGMSHRTAYILMVSLMYAISVHGFADPFSFRMWSGIDRNGILVCRQLKEAMNILEWSWCCVVSNGRELTAMD